MQGHAPDSHGASLGESVEMPSTRLIKIAEEAKTNSEIVKSAPNTTLFGRMDEVKAARELVLLSIYGSMTQARTFVILQRVPYPSTVADRIAFANDPDSVIL